MADFNYIYHGLWWVIHVLSLHATTIELKNNYIMTINSICEHFECNTCKPDFEKFLKTHPIQSYKIDKETGLFKWSYDLHYMVNKKLNKSQISFEEALLLYKNHCQNCMIKSNSLKKDVNSFLKPIEIEQNHFNFTSR